MELIPYNKNYRDRARDLRKSYNLAEVILWKYISRRKLDYQFLRQRPIGIYIVDFYCKELRLAIEIDGKIHLNQIEQDKFRQGELELFGITFLRFSDEEVKNNVEEVITHIKRIILRLADSPPPSEGGIGH